MRVNYKNWIPKKLLLKTVMATVLALLLLVISLRVDVPSHPFWKMTLRILLLLAVLILGLASLWGSYAYAMFSYHGKRKLSKQVIEGIADRIVLKDGSLGLDVGCGSGALTIACAKRFPQAKMVGVDFWGQEYSFSKALCEENAKAEAVDNVIFEKGNAISLDYDDESFDMVTSNYVYHNISGHSKQKLIKETLRVLKKGGSFALHDLMSYRRFGDMNLLVKELLDQGFEKVDRIDTTKHLFMSPREAKLLRLVGSTLLIGTK